MEVPGRRRVRVQRGHVGIRGQFFGAAAEASFPAGRSAALLVTLEERAAGGVGPVAAAARVRVGVGGAAEEAAAAAAAGAAGAAALLEQFLFDLRRSNLMIF